MTRARLAPVKQPASLDDKWCVWCATTAEPGNWVPATYTIQVFVKGFDFWTSMAAVCDEHAKRYVDAGIEAPGD